MFSMSSKNRIWSNDFNDIDFDLNGSIYKQIMTH